MNAIRIIYQMVNGGMWKVNGHFDDEGIFVGIKTKHQLLLYRYGHQCRVLGKFQVVCWNDRNPRNSCLWNAFCRFIVLMNQLCYHNLTYFLSIRKIVPTND